MRKKALHALKGRFVVSSVSGPACPIDLPEKDRPIFLTAVKCRAMHLLTGDIRHFGPFLNDPSRTAGVAIMTVAGFLEGEINRYLTLFSWYGFKERYRQEGNPDPLGESS